MKTFIDEHFLLQNETAKRLYHDFVAALPIIDYHNHLAPADIAGDRQFANITELWLAGDHYKWRAMRSAGVPEEYITGNAGPFDKFSYWAATVPKTLRNPLFHWTHLELRRYFAIDEFLTPESAKHIYDRCNEMLKDKAYSTRNLLRRMKVEVVCTTDDPADTLEFHQQLVAESSDIKMLPGFRPDKLLAVEDCKEFNLYLSQLSNKPVNSFAGLCSVLAKRIDKFHDLGGRLADHGLSTLNFVEFDEKKVEEIFQTVINNGYLKQEDIAVYQSALLYHLGKMYHDKGWVQQFHLGAMRNNNERMFRALGPDIGMDSMGDFNWVLPLARLLSKLDNDGSLARTILYNLNPKDNAAVATLAGNFNDGTEVGKIQYGAAWWFLDQKQGIEQQLNDVSNYGLLSNFVGMLTDSRSLLSFPRHEYFRRVLCNLIGQEAEDGLLPRDEAMLGELVRNVSYFNAKAYFNF